MALAELELTLTLTAKDSCTTLQLVDAGTRYDAGDAPGGWGGTNPEPEDIVSTILVITDPNGTVTTTDISPLLADLTTYAGTIDLGEYIIYTVDGKYDTKLTLTFGSEVKSYYLCNYLLCKVRCCVDTLWANFASDTVSSDCGCTSSSLQQKALNAEAIFKALCAAAACSNTTTRDALLLKLQRVCNLEKCNCN